MDSFVPIPTSLIYMLDSDCLKVIAILIQKESYWKNKGQLKDGWFMKAIKELKTELGCANSKDVGCVIQALVDSELIYVTAYDKKNVTARFKINWDKLNEFNETSLYDMKEFDIKLIRKLPRNSITTYNKNTDTKCTSKQPQSITICNSTIANIDNSNKKDNTAMMKDNKSTIAVEDDYCAILNKLACFISYDCPMSKIVHSIRTKTMCANKQLIALQENLNRIVAQYGNSIATADVCNKLWDELTSTLSETEYMPTNGLEQQKYNEIILSVDRIGYDIAYICKRRYLKDAKALEESSHLFWMNCESGPYKDIYINYLKWLIAQYTIDETMSETKCCSLTKDEIIDRICMANDYFKKGYEKWKAYVDRCRTGTQIL